MIIPILLMHVIFFVDCSEYTLFPLPNDILNILFMDIQNEKAYKNINRQKFFNYVHSSSETYYRVAFPVLAQTNRSFYSYFANCLQLECTITYLKNNILTNIDLIDKQQKILFPLEKITCFFSDIPLGPKDTIQLSIAQLADLHLEKYSPSNVNTWTHYFKKLETAYLNIPLQYQHYNTNSLKDNINIFTNCVAETSISIEQKTNELQIIPIECINANKVLSAVIDDDKITLSRQKSHLKELSCAVETGHIFNALAQGILKKKYKSKISFTQLYGKLEKKQKNRGLKIEAQKIILLKLLIIQMFSPYLNTNTHKDMLGPILAYAPYQINNDALKELNAMIYSFKNNTPHSFENDWNRIYSTFWSEENFKNLVVHHISKMLTAYTGLGLPYLPTTLDCTLDIDLSNTAFYFYYHKLGIFKGEMPSTFFKNITTVNYLVNNSLFPTACSSCSTTFFDIPIKFSFVEPFLISNGVLTIDHKSYPSNIWEELNTLHAKNATLYQSIIDRIKSVNILTAKSICKQQPTSPFFDFLNNLPENVEIQCEFLKDFIQNDVLNIDKNFYSDDTSKILNTFRDNHKKLYKSIMSSVKKVNVTTDTFKYKWADSVAFFDFLNNLPENVEIQCEFLNDFIQNDMLSIDQSLYSSDTLKILNTFRDNHKKLYKSIMSSIKKVNVTTDTFKYKWADSVAFFDFLNNLPENVEIQFEFLKNFIQNDVLNIDKSFYSNDISKILNTFRDNHKKLYKSIMSSIKNVNITTDTFKYEWADSVAFFDFLNNLPENVEIQCEFLKDFIQNNESSKAVSFIAAFLKRQPKQNGQLLINNILLPLVKYKDKEIYKPLFEDVNTIICNASTIKELAHIMNHCFSVTNSESTTDDMQLKIITPSDIIKKDFENSLYLTLFYSALIKSRDYNNFLPAFKNMLKESYIRFMPNDLMYIMYKVSPYLIIYLKYLLLFLLSDNITFCNVEMMQVFSGLISLTFLPVSFIIDYPSDTKRLLISKLLHDIFISIIIYDSIFIYRSWLSSTIIFCILIDYHHINQSSLFFNLIHAGIQTIKNRSCKPTNVSIEVEPSI